MGEKKKRKTPQQWCPIIRVEILNILSIIIPTVHVSTPITQGKHGLASFLHHPPPIYASHRISDMTFIKTICLFYWNKNTPKVNIPCKKKNQALNINLKLQEVDESPVHKNLWTRILNPWQHLDFRVLKKKIYSSNISHF